MRKQTRRRRFRGGSNKHTRFANEARVREFNNNLSTNLPAIPTKPNTSASNLAIVKASQEEAQASRPYPLGEYDANILAQVTAAHDSLNDMLESVKAIFCKPLTPEEQISFNRMRDYAMAEANQYVKRHATRNTPVEKARRLHSRFLIRYLKNQIVHLLNDDSMPSDSVHRFLVNIQCIMYRKQLELMFHNVE